MPARQVPRRPRLGALGLRGRIVGLVLVTTVATLAVAALALLGPLESSLRGAEKKTLERELRGATNGFVHLNPAQAVYINPAYAGTSPALQGVYSSERRAWLALVEQEGSLGARVGASEVAVLGYPSVSGQSEPIAVWPHQSAAKGDSYSDAAKAFRYSTHFYSFISINGTDYVGAALVFRADGSRWVLAVRKSLDEVSDAVAAVRNAFVTAALAGVLLSLILGIPLSATLVRRLRRLRQAAVTLARGGPGAEVQLPVDRARDEVGDLARTFATMQRQLRQQEQARRAFVATASHELRTPLASLDGMLELLDDDLRHGETDLNEVRALLDRARAQSRRLGRLAADLLDLSRLDAEVELRSEPVELGELSRAVLAEFELGTVERGVDAVLVGSGDRVWALADPGSVARILRILLDNAVRHSPGGTEVRVELRNGAQAELSVSDQGSGIAPEDREIIFERFQRGRDTAGQAGFGLGLAIGRELAARMGGALTLDEAYGPGARLILTLPVARPREVPTLTVG